MMNELTYETERTDLRLLRGKGAGEGMGLGVGTSRCKQLPVEWIKNKVLADSTGNTIQYPLIINNEKECMSIYLICITESHWCTAEIHTTL